jgi:ribonuclease HII|tara:strand:- start:3256 stop:3876 length:621 start_codon:yes stop_codon:yes gene_type:complete
MLKKFYYENTIEAGVDEAGRGPLFGRVYVGAVVLPQGDEFDHSLMKDSKKLSHKKRLKAYEYIKENALDWTCFWISAEEIDKINVYKATHNAMHKALDQLNVRPENILVDGNKFYVYKHDNEIIPHVCIIGGDNKYTSIAAASIIAKVEHDKYINKMCDENPTLDSFYDLRNNKGYGTKKHIAGIEKHGISIWHRKTFGICRRWEN